MSPFGIWKSGTPAGITGLSAYYDIYCDAIAWLQAGSVDYLTPQLYWAIGGGQDYTKLSIWWSDACAANSRCFAPGLAAYRIISAYSASELPNQIRMNRLNANTRGNVFFTTSSLLNNPKGFADSLKYDLHRYKALRPVFHGLDPYPPNTPANIRFARMPNSGIAALQWDVPPIANDGDSANMYVIYKFSTSAITPPDLNETNIADITSNRFFPTRQSYGSPLFFTVTALDRNCNESNRTAAVEITAPQSPLLAAPANGAVNQRDTTILRWNYADGAGAYAVQVSVDSTFSSSFVLIKNDVADTAIAVTVGIGQQKYFWRTMAANSAGQSGFSQVFSYRTGFPQAVVLAQPAASSSGNPVSPLLKWFKQNSASSYRVQFAKGVIGPATILFDSSGITDTTLQIYYLLNGEAYFWRVRAVNQFGSGEWSSQWGFRVMPALAERESMNIPEEFALGQNFPNPFNPDTRIQFSVATTRNVKLSVFDLLGNEIRELTDDTYSPGEYSIGWDGRNNLLEHVPSGIYICRMNAGNFVQTRKLSLVK
jgi:hypothetical protein